MKEESRTGSRARLRDYLRSSGNLISFMDQTMDAIMVVQDRHIIYSNRSVEKLFGYKQKEVVGKPYLEFVSDAARPVIMDRYDKRVAGDNLPPLFETEVVCKNGAVKSVEISSCPIQDEAMLTSILIIRDISERKAAEESLKEFNERYSAIVESAKDMVLMVQDGVIKYINPAVREMMGYESEKMVDTPFIDYIAVEFREIMLNNYRSRIDGGDPPAIYESAIICSDGSIKQVEVSARVITHQGRPADIGIVRDISERKKNELLLKESEEKFKSLSENIADALVVNVDGKCVWTNRAFSEVLGYSAKEAIGKTVEDLAAPEELPGIYDRMKRRERGEALSPYYETVLIRKDGKRIDIEASITKVKFDKREADQVIFRDISYRKRSEYEIKRRQLRARMRLILHDRLRETNNIDQCLKLGCEAIHKAEIFKRAVFTLHNKKRQITHMGYVGIDKKTAEAARKAPPPSLEIAKKIMQKEYRISDSYFIPIEADFKFNKVARYVPQRSRTLDMGQAWKNGDELFVPIFRTKKEVAGWLSVDTPFNKLRPDIEVIQYLEQIADIVYFKIRDILNIAKIESESQALKEKNIALREILGHIEEEKVSFRKEVAAQIEGTILPAIDKAINKKGEIRKSYINVARTQLRKLASISSGTMQVYSKLSRREVEVCQLIIAGHSNKEIAETLAISLSTVQKHRESIRRKFGLKNKPVNLSVYLQKLDYL